MVDEKALETAVRVWIDAEPGPDAQSERNAMRAAITAYLQALSPGSTGETEGWVLVPKVPSKQMVETGFDALEASLPTYRETGRDCHPYDLDCRDWDTCSRKEDIGLVVYRAMLSAAGER